MIYQMANQYLQIRRTIANRKDGKAKGKIESILINKKSIGTMYLNGKMYDYNMHLLPTDRIDFDALEKERNRKRNIYIRRG